MRTRTVEYEGETTYRIVVTEATALVGMKRHVLRGRAQAYLATLRTEVGDGNGEGEEADDRPVCSELDLSALNVIAAVTYPALVAAASEMVGLNSGLTMEEFIVLPDALINDWEDATYELNPHWLLRLEPEDEDEAEVEKKALSDNASAFVPA